MTFKELRVKVTTDSKKDEVVQKTATSLSITTKQPASENRANMAVINLIAEFYSVPTKQVIIIKGHNNPQKTVKVYL